MKHFLSCDWGSSSFRLRLVNADELTVAGEVTSSSGIAATYEASQREGKSAPDRERFYNHIINDHIGLLEQRLSQSLDGMPVVISGMASSSIGMIEIPYKDIPFLTNGADLEARIVRPGKIFNRTTIIISGVKTHDDVMRGEETKLAGTGGQQNGIYILPGTHPKHAMMADGLVTGFTTYMTGEYFDLLSRKSMLAVSVEAGGKWEEEHHLRSFRQGVESSMESHLLHGSFVVRTNALFEKYTKQENYFYLSGLLVGSELQALLRQKGAPIRLLGDANMNRVYSLALQTLQLPAAAIENADEALIRGQARVYARLCE